jgi:tetraacyldisaccharide 4'-kinase
MMRDPGFWWRSPGFEARLLRPLGVLYGAVTGWRMARQGRRSPLAVFCVGNFVAGGAGKTPFAVEIAQRLTHMGERPAFLTRGHGGSLQGPVLVATRHNAAEVGDEALLLARHARTIVARSRVAGARLAETSGATVIVMDDGLQNASLAKDLAFAVVDAEAGVGNGLCLPAGPLRAPLASQWPFVRALVVMGAGENGEVLRQEAVRRGLPVVAAWLVPDPPAAAALLGRPVVAFAGIGRPEKFFATLRAIGAVLVGERSFPDHHPFRAGELEALAAQARAEHAILVTTEKDMVRIEEQVRGGAGPTALLGDVQLRVLPVRLRIEDGPALAKLLADTVSAHRMGVGERSEA